MVHAGLFGSTARGQEGAKDDVDSFVELNPVARTGIDGVVGLHRFVGEIFREPVDVVTSGSLA